MESLTCTAVVSQPCQTKMEKSVGMLDDNLRTIRAGKATPQLLEPVKVNAYESQLKLEEVATITVAWSKIALSQVFIYGR